MMIRILLLLSLVVMPVLSACSDSDEPLSAGKPKDADRKRWENRGRLTGDDGWDLFGGDADKNGGASPIGVNSFLWRATLDTLSFMPMASADPFGGVVLTDWYEDPKTPGERFKVNALILDRQLRADGLRLSVFKQRKDETSGQWADADVDPKVARDIEDTILTRARQLRVAQGTE